MPSVAVNHKNRRCVYFWTEIAGLIVPVVFLASVARGTLCDHGKWRIGRTGMTAGCTGAGQRLRGQSQATRLNTARSDRNCPRVGIRNISTPMKIRNEQGINADDTSAAGRSRPNGKTGDYYQKLRHMVSDGSVRTGPLLTSYLHRCEKFGLATSAALAKWAQAHERLPEPRQSLVPIPTSVVSARRVRAATRAVKSAGFNSAATRAKAALRM